MGVMSCLGQGGLRSLNALVSGYISLLLPRLPTLPNQCYIQMDQQIGLSQQQ